LTHGQGRQYFFFEKKKQKTFIWRSQHGARRLARLRRETSKSFLVLFFKKELLPCCLAFLP
jgi:hypothetical protein